MYQIGQGLRYKDSEGHVAVAKLIFHIYIGGLPTDIEENVKIKELKNECIYNLNGLRTNILQKGMNIVDGKKIWVK